MQWEMKRTKIAAAGKGQGQPDDKRVEQDAQLEDLRRELRLSKEERKDARTIMPTTCLPRPTFGESWVWCRSTAASASSSFSPTGNTSPSWFAVVTTILSSRPSCRLRGQCRGGARMLARYVGGRGEILGRI